MKTKYIIRICLICLILVTIAFLALKLTIWKVLPDSYVKDFKKDLKPYHSSGTGKEIENSAAVFIRKT